MSLLESARDLVTSAGASSAATVVGGLATIASAATAVSETVSSFFPAPKAPAEVPAPIDKKIYDAVGCILALCLINTGLYDKARLTRIHGGFIPSSREEYNGVFSSIQEFNRGRDRRAAGDKREDLEIYPSCIVAVDTLFPLNSTNHDLNKMMRGIWKRALAGLTSLGNTTYTKKNHTDFNKSIENWSASIRQIQNQDKLRRELAKAESKTKGKDDGDTASATDSKDEGKTDGTATGAGGSASVEKEKPERDFATIIKTKLWPEEQIKKAYNLLRDIDKTKDLDLKKANKLLLENMLREKGKTFCQLDKAFKESLTTFASASESIVERKTKGDDSDSD